MGSLLVVVCVSCGAGHRSRWSVDKFHTKEPWPDTLQTCVFCDNNFYVSQWDDMPAPLLHLTQEQIYALRPLVYCREATNAGKLVSGGTWTFLN